MGAILINSTKEANEKGGICTAIVVFVLLLGIIFGIYCGIVGIALALWNGCLCNIFTSIPEVTFWQMWGIYLLFDILVKPVVTSGNKKD